MSAYVSVKHSPGSYDQPAYWHATCHPCEDWEVDCYPVVGAEGDLQSAGEEFEPVLAWAIHHAYNCPAVLAQHLQDVTGWRWCIDCNRIDPPCPRCMSWGTESACSDCPGDGLEHTNETLLEWQLADLRKVDA